MTWKYYLFTSICWRIKSFYRLSTKFKQKYNVYYVNKLKSIVQFTLKKQLKHKQKIIIGHIFYSNMPNYNRFRVNCYLKANCNILFQPLKKVRSQTIILFYRKYGTIYTSNLFFFLYRYSWYKIYIKVWVEYKNVII